MIREQLELFPKKIKKTKSIIIRQSSSKHFRGWNDVMVSIAKNFSVSDRKYFAGMIDGDGSFHIPINNPKKLRMLSVFICSVLPSSYLTCISEISLFPLIETN